MSWITKLTDLVGGDLLGSVKDIIDEAFTSDEEKNDFVLKLEQEKLHGKKLDLEFIQAIINDLDSARKANVEIQKILVG